MPKGKTICVFGAGGLLGKELVTNLLTAGAKVIAVDVSIDKLQIIFREMGLINSSNPIIMDNVDITCEVQVCDFFQRTEGIDGIVNCAYPRNSSYGKKFADVSLASFNENISLHLGSSFLIMRESAKYFLADKRKFSLVNIASIYGVIAPRFEIYDGTEMTMPIEYAAIKSAIIHLNKYMAKAVGHSDFRVNSVSPGGILDGQPESFLDRYKDRSLSHGMLKPYDLIGAIQFLLSDESTFMNGQNIIVDDGFTL